MGDKSVTAARPESSEGIQYHVSARRGQIGYVFMPGDPDRLPKIAKFSDSAHDARVDRGRGTARQEVSCWVYSFGGSFLCGQGRPWVGGYLPPEAEKLVERLRKQNVFTMEMEASTIFTLSGIYGLRSGCVLAVYANRYTDRFEVKGEEDVCNVAC